MARKSLRRWLTLAAVLGVPLLALAVAIWWSVAGRTSAEPPMDDVTLFKYGSVGAEGKSLPLLVWQALPEVCPDQLPGGYSSIGFLYEHGHDTPVGVSTRTLGVPRAAFNCAVCHTGSYRVSPSAPRQMVLGMPGHQMDLQRFTRFALSCIQSPSFTPARVLAAIERRTPLGATDRLLYGYVLVPALRVQGRSLAAEFAWFDGRPAFGPGRFDGFAPYKDMRADASIATADIMSLWRQADRGSRGRHWDGNTSDPGEGAIASALGFGATASTINIETLRRVVGWMQSLPAPAYPFPVDAALARKGAAVFAAECGSCHAPDGPRRGEVIPVAAIGTDAKRHEAFTAETARALHALGAGHPWQLRSYRPTGGYVAGLLDGVWARAPYLHNGSVPNLRELLEPAARRSRVFYRGYDLYDPSAAGFVTTGPDAERAGFRFDTSLPGNGNTGHEYGTSLPRAQKDALLEYLKTL